jgi:hypothetical protein
MVILHAYPVEGNLYIVCLALRKSDQIRSVSAYKLGYTSECTFR